MMQASDSMNEPPEPGEPHATKKQSINQSLNQSAISTKKQTPIQSVNQSFNQSVNQSADGWTGLKHLQQLLQTGLIDDEEFARRKQQIVDQLTGTRSDRTKVQEINQPINQSPYNSSKPPSYNQSINQSKALVNRSLTRQFNASEQSFGQPINQSVNQGINQSVLTRQFNQSDQSFGQSYNESIERAIYAECDDFDNSLSSEDSLNDSTDDSYNQSINQSIIEQSLHSASGVLVRGPPDFSSIRSERAVVHMFDMETSSWLRRSVNVKIEKRNFARGSLRIAYHMTGLQSIEQEERDRTQIRTRRRANRTINRSVNQSINPMTDYPPPPVPSSRSYVAKLSIDPFELRESYFADVVMQHYARAYARKYNSYGPPKPIEFLDAWLVELIDRPNQPLCACEVFVDGAYRKHNNNFGFVSEDERNTPQAFSHFSYESSNHAILICDIQGVGDVFTDPQIHSHDGIGFGKGNMGQSGIEQFCQSHRCNAICKYLKLTKCNPKQMDDGLIDCLSEGTMPATTFMSFQSVDTVRIEFNMTGSNSPVLKPRIVNQSTNQSAPIITQIDLPKKKRSTSKTPLMDPPKKSPVCCCTIM